MYVGEVLNLFLLQRLCAAHEIIIPCHDFTIIFSNLDITVLFIEFSCFGGIYGGYNKFHITFAKVIRNWLQTWNLQAGLWTEPLIGYGKKTLTILMTKDAIYLLYGTFSCVQHHFQYWMLVSNLWDAYMHRNSWLKPYYKYTSGDFHLRKQSKLCWVDKILATGIRKKQINFYMTCIIIF